MASNSNHRGMSSGIQIGSAWFQRKINLRPQHRGVHLVTEEILRQMPELGQFSVGLCHVQSEKFHHIYLAFFTDTFFCYFHVECRHDGCIHSPRRAKESALIVQIYTCDSMSASMRAEIYIQIDIISLSSSSSSVAVVHSEKNIK